MSSTQRFSTTTTWSLAALGLASAATAHHCHKRWKRQHERLERQANDQKQCRLIVISGCERGLGRLLAQSLADHANGKTQQSSSSDYALSNIMVLALTLTNETANEWNKEGNKRLVALKCDVTSKEDIVNLQSFVPRLLEEHEAMLYAIVNNAAITNPGDFLWFCSKDKKTNNRIDEFRKVMEVNFFGQLEVTGALLPFMLPTASSLGSMGARILNMSSVCGTSATGANASYSASKFAVEAFSDSLRQELQAFNIAVCKIRPGQVATEIQKDWMERLMENFRQAPEDVRDRYGNHAYADKMEKVFAAITPSSTNKDDKTSDNDTTSPPPFTCPTVVIQKMMDVLLVTPQKEMKSFYWIGVDAHVFWQALTWMPAKWSDAIKRKIVTITPAFPEYMPPPQVISHVTIHVRQLDRSLEFYKAFGLLTYGSVQMGKDNRRRVFLRSGSTAAKSKWSTMVLLEENPDMPQRQKSYDTGMTRLCIYPRNLLNNKARLDALGIKPMAPMVERGSERIVAYSDPDGFVVYLIQFGGIMGKLVNAHLAWTSTKDPNLFHWTINVADSQHGFTVFKNLGFQALFDANKNQVQYHMLPAFGIPEKGSEIKRIILCSLPQDKFVCTIMEWVKPASTRQGTELLNGITISVDDVPAALQKARKAGMYVKEEVGYKELPVYGRVLSGTAYVEENSCPVHFCSFSHKP